MPKDLGKEQEFWSAWLYTALHFIFFSTF